MAIFNYFSLEILFWAKKNCSTAIAKWWSFVFLINYFLISKINQLFLGYVINISFCDECNCLKIILIDSLVVFSLIRFLFFVYSGYDWQFLQDSLQFTSSGYLEMCVGHDFLKSFTPFQRIWNDGGEIYFNPNCNMKQTIKEYHFNIYSLLLLHIANY